MERRKLGQLEVSAIGLGCATMTPFYGEPDPASAVETIRHAAELGIDLLDTSDAYGNGRNEELISQAVAGRRHRYIIASKFGNLRRSDGTPTADGRPEYVKAACGRSLRRLRTEFIDLYYIHRVDPAVPIEDTVGAMGELVQAGKVRFLGISEAGPQTIRRAHATFPMSAVQIEYSLWTRDVEREILGLCRELGIGFVAYSPLGRGFLTGTVTGREGLQAADARLRMPRFREENLQRNLELVEELRRLAAAEGCTPAQLALAWILSRGRSIVPIAGTSHRSWVEENAGAADIPNFRGDGGRSRADLLPGSRSRSTVPRTVQRDPRALKALAVSLAVGNLSFPFGSGRHYSFGSAQRQRNHRTRYGNWHLPEFPALLGRQQPDALKEASPESMWLKAGARLAEPNCGGRIPHQHGERDPTAPLRGLAARHGCVAVV